MTKYHLNPTTGDPGLCKAVNGRCPFGTDEEHFSSKEEARAGYELLQSVFTKPVEHSKATLIALKSDLDWKGKVPGWLKKRAKEQEKTFGTTPKILDVIPSKMGPLMVIWEQDSMNPIDIHIQKERGDEMNRVTFNLQSDGKEVGYLKMGYSDERSIARSFGSDYWRPFAWAEDRKGSDFGFTNYVKNSKNPLAKETPLRQELSEEKRLAAKKAVWARTHIALGKTPPSFDMNRIGYAPLVNLKSDHAPEDEAILDKEIDLLRDELKEEMDRNHAWTATPYIDYIKVDDELRGQGMGHSLYVFGSRMQAKEGRSLRASGAQTDEAKKSWQRMLKSGLPVKTVTYKENMTKNSKLKKGFELDFR